MITSTKSTIAFCAILFCSVMLTFQSCKKKTIAPSPANLVCDGRDYNTFMPLNQGNKWEVTSTNPDLGHTLEVSGTKNISGTEYFETHYSALTVDYFMYYRTDSYGDVYKYNATDNKEYLEIPAYPTGGQVIATYNSGDYLRVADTNAKFGTGKCFYFSLLKVELYSNGVVISTIYYKKGLGKVAELTSTGLMGLNGVTLN